MIPQWIIEKKRDGLELAPEELHAFIEGYTRREIPDYQMAALAMAIYFRGLSFDETTVLTDAMMRSGDCLDFSDVDRPTVDKHSTGGIGDKLSLVLAPLAATCGVAVPMISGRGLGLTGGTLDKLESIPGFRSRMSIPRFRKQVATLGCAIVGQSPRLTPADRKLYALRDVTGTVPSIPLIVASIMSKKLAEGAQSLVLDVKCGRGAFMRNRKDARQLALTLLAVGRRLGRRMSALITDMDTPLGRTVGNALEVREAIALLKGEGPADARALTLALGAEMLVLAGIGRDREAASRELEKWLDNGRALERFQRMIEAQQGDPRIVEQPGRLPTAPVVRDVPAPRAGRVAAVDAETLGRICLQLGAGRRRAADGIDPAVGVDALVKPGESVALRQPLMRLHAASADAAAALLETAMGAVEISDRRIADRPLIYETLSEPEARSAMS